MTASIYVFDAYGTLFDVHSAVARRKSEIGPEAERLSAVWRTKQLEYSWTRSMMGRYRDFWSLTEDALDVAAETCGVDLSDGLRETLLEAYRSLDAYPEVAGVLGQLKNAGSRTAILTNAPPVMVEAAVASAGLGELLDATLSVDELRLFKTDPRAYELVGAQFSVAPQEVSLQSSNRWDIAGAHAFGFRTAWINRTSAPDEYADLPPDRVLSSLEGLLED